MVTAGRPACTLRLIRRMNASGSSEKAVAIALGAGNTCGRRSLHCTAPYSCSSQEKSSPVQRDARSARPARAASPSQSIPVVAHLRHRIQFNGHRASSPARRYARGSPLPFSPTRCLLRPDPSWRHAIDGTRFRTRTSTLPSKHYYAFSHMVAAVCKRRSGMI